MTTHELQATTGLNKHQQAARERGVRAWVRRIVRLRAETNAPERYIVQAVEEAYSLCGNTCGMAIGRGKLCPQCRREARALLMED